MLAVSATQRGQEEGRAGRQRVLDYTGMTCQRTVLKPFNMECCTLDDDLRRAALRDNLHICGGPVNAEGHMNGKACSFHEYRSCSPQLPEELVQQW